jgi:hypothetical protein
MAGFSGMMPGNWTAAVDGRRCCLLKFWATFDVSSIDRVYGLYISCQGLTHCPPGRDRIVGRNVADDPPNIGNRPGTPNFWQGSGRLGMWRVEFTFRQPQ